MRVTSDRQTLILAGETPPPRSVAERDRSSVDTVGSDPDTESSGASQRITIISARVDAIVTQGLYTNSPASLPALPPKLHQAYVVSNRGSSSNAANAYARTRDLSDRTHLIDTYA